jgi:hypothetical protein
MSPPEKHNAQLPLCEVREKEIVYISAPERVKFATATAAAAANEEHKKRASYLYHKQKKGLPCILHARLL